MITNGKIHGIKLLYSKSSPHAKEERILVGNTENNYMYVCSTLIILAELPFKNSENENLGGFKLQKFTKITSMQKKSEL